MRKIFYGFIAIALVLAIPSTSYATYLTDKVSIDDLADTEANKIPFGDADGLGNANLHWDSTNSWLGIGSSAATPGASLHLSEAAIVGTHTGSDVTGMIEWDGTNFQVYNGTAWIDIDLGETNATNIALNSAVIQSNAADIATLQAADGAGITAADITNWNSAYGWGDHSAAGYGQAADITSNDTDISNLQTATGVGTGTNVTWTGTNYLPATASTIVAALENMDTEIASAITASAVTGAEAVFDGWDKNALDDLQLTGLSATGTGLTYNSTTGAFTFDQTALSITESQISDLQDYNGYSDAHINGKTTTVIDALNTGSGAGLAEDGYALVWNNTSSEYVLTDSATLESDPIYTAWDKSTGISIVSSQVSDWATVTADWDTAFGWGDHSVQNYVDLDTNAFIDDDTMATATATNFASAESIVAYVGAEIGNISTTFGGLTDTPASYTGLAGSAVRVNALEDGLEYFDITDSFSAVGNGLSYSNGVYTLAEGSLSIASSQISDWATVTANWDTAYTWVNTNGANVLSGISTNEGNITSNDTDISNLQTATGVGTGTNVTWTGTNYLPATASTIVAAIENMDTEIASAITAAAVTGTETAFDGWDKNEADDYATANFTTDFAAESTTNLSEGTNLYFTDARVAAAVVGTWATPNYLTNGSTIQAGMESLDDQILVNANAIGAIAEVDTLDSVTGRGASTANAITVGGLTVGTLDGIVTASGGVLSADGTPLDVSNGGTGVTTFGGANTLLFTTAADTLASITTANNGLLVTSGTGVPSIATALPAGITATTQTAGDNTTAVATTEFVTTAVTTASATDSFVVNRSATAVSATTTGASGTTILGVTDVTASRTITVASADVAAGKIMIIKDESGQANATNTITVATQGTELIDGAASVQIVVAYGVLNIYSDGANWFTF